MTGPRGLRVKLNFTRGFAKHRIAFGSDWVCRTCPWLSEEGECASEQSGALCEEGMFPRPIKVVHGAGGWTLRSPGPKLSHQESQPPPEQWSCRGEVRGWARIPGSFLTEVMAKAWPELADTVHGFPHMAGTLLLVPPLWPGVHVLSPLDLSS